VVPSSLFSALTQSAHFPVIAVLHPFNGLKKITNLYMSFRKFLGVSIAVKNTTIGFIIEEISKFHSLSFSVTNLGSICSHKF
jgi:hypothetical protein